MKPLSLGLKPTVKKTCAQVVLDQIDGIVPCSALARRVATHNIDICCAPFASETMLRIRFLQLCFALNDPAMEAAFFEAPICREFFQLQEFAYLLDESTILRFHHWMEKHKLAGQILVIVSDLLPRLGTVVDTALIAGCELGKEQVARSAMHSAQEENQWHSGTKAHIDLDADLGWRHTVKGILINVNDVAGESALLQGKEDAAFEMRAAGASTGARMPMRTRCGRIGLHSAMRKTLDKVNTVAALADKVEYLKAGVRGRYEDMFRVPVRPCQGALSGQNKINGATSDAARFVEPANSAGQAAGDDSQGLKQRDGCRRPSDSLKPAKHRARRK